MCQLLVTDLGRISYQDALARQGSLVERLKDVRINEAHLLLLEHDPPVITLGRRGCTEHILASDNTLADEGIEVHRCARGGEVTYHGPGQLVGYPIVRLRAGGWGVRRYVADLERMLILVLGRLGLHGVRREGLAGVWVGQKKVASIGIAVSRPVAYHGFALNVATDLKHTRYIVPCGAPDCTTTTISQLLQANIDISKVKGLLVECFCKVLGFRERFSQDAVGRKPNERA